MAAFTRSLKQTQFTRYLIPCRTKFMGYSKREGVPREFINYLTMDIDLSRGGINRYLARKRWLALLDDHKFIPERHQILGPDLATAHFMVRRGAKVKFVGRERWFRQDEKGNMYLPNRQVAGFHLEAIDASGMDITYVAFDNMIQLDSLRFLNFSKCRYFNDWCMAKLYMFQDTLEFLDISGCTEVTNNGLACLHHLKKLKGLKLSDLPNVKDIGLMAILLEEVLPECTVFGINPEQLNPPGSEQAAETAEAETGASDFSDSDKPQKVETETERLQQNDDLRPHLQKKSGAQR